MAARTYLDFDLAIHLEADGSMRVEVLGSPAGEAEEVLDWPLSDQDLEIFLLRVGQSQRGKRRIDSPQMEAARAFGEEIYNAVFSGQVGTTFARSLDEAERSGEGLRVRLRTDAPDLTDVPWEFMYSPELHRFLVVSTATPLVRYIEQSQLISPLAVEPPLHILGMVSNPTDVAELDVEEEWARVNDSLGELVASGYVKLHRLHEATMTALHHELRRGVYHVFHFIGHGQFDKASDQGVLMFEDERQRGLKVSSEQLGTILHDHDSLRLVLLNSCEGARASREDPFAGTAQGLIQQGIPAVIAMQFEITDNAAITFSRDFYSALADGYPVDAAVTEARKAIFTRGNDVEWATPVLHMRTPEGKIFDVRREDRAVPTVELTAQLAVVDTMVQRGDLEEAVAELERISNEFPDSAIAAGKLDTAQRQLRAERLYASARVLFRAEQWQAVLDRFVEIRALDPHFEDVENLQQQARSALEQGERKSNLAAWYSKAEQARTAQDWEETLRLLGLIAAEDSTYKDVQALTEEATQWRDAAEVQAAARAAFAADDWQAVISRFEELRLLGTAFADDPDGLEAAAREHLAEEERKEGLQPDYDAAIALVGAERWLDAIEILDRIEAEDPDFPGVATLRTAIREQAGETIQGEEEATTADGEEGGFVPFWRRWPAISAAPVAAGVIAVIAIVVAAIVLLLPEPDPPMTASDEPATTTAAPTTAAVVVPGSENWTATPVHLSEGDEFSINAVGTISYSQGAGAETGPDGDPSMATATNVLIAPGSFLDAPHGALIGRIGEDGVPFFIGAEFSGTAAGTGQLYLGINDQRVDNNDGAFRAEVTRGRTAEGLSTTTSSAPLAFFEEFDLPGTSITASPTTLAAGEQPSTSTELIATTTTISPNTTSSPTTIVPDTTTTIATTTSAPPTTTTTLPAHPLVQIVGRGTGSGSVTGFPSSCKSYSGAQGTVMCEASIEAGSTLSITWTAGSGSWAWQFGGCDSRQRISDQKLVCGFTVADQPTVRIDGWLHASAQTYTGLNNGEGSITGTIACSNSGSGGAYKQCGPLDLPIGTTVTLTAAGVNGYTFSHWSTAYGKCSGAGATCTYTVTGFSNVQAFFKPA